ncbi:serine hydrolase domain-containing protein [Bythopirellula polymerisocia]|uniref:Beta-lactamase n=1 Tax=Bythopirellula polymerisocia TaxID=2528003 RepID=A0A5C6D5R4_9BACT|nr:serine hydrolase domain-containing protein [Bythopirellula polymerisocia]TWU30239.1 Beta-lactamase precursor [Bythopirellula polymerisocia]
MYPDSPMERDDLQQAWHAQSSQTRVTIDGDLLLQEVQRNQRDFRATINRRDSAEIGISLLLIPVWIYMGIAMASPWTWYLTVPALVWIAGFILIYRMRHRPDPIKPDAPLLSCVKRSLTEVEDQIWLLRNVFWWYLLPPAIPILAFTAHLAWLKSKNSLDTFSDVNIFIFVFFLAGFYFLYFINQRAVRVELEPRREELLSLLASLGDELEDKPTRELATTFRAMNDKGSSNLGRWLLAAVSAIVTLVVIAMASGFFDSSYDGPPQSFGPEGVSLASFITDLRKEKNLVGLAAMVVVDGEVEAAAANGERMKGSGVPVEIGDSWHLGGVAKSITATMIARLVESGQMNWSDTLGECFPDASMHEVWKTVTLKQLLTDTAGAPANFPLEVRRIRPPLGPECTLPRRKAVLEVIVSKPEYPPGEQYVYSNVGCTIASAMAEKVTGVSWKDLVIREVYEPLGLTSAGFGPPKSPDAALPQPRGHRAVLGGKVSVNDEADNTTIMGPSGIVHMTLSDLCTYASDHMHGELGEGKLLSTETYKQLHTPELSYYAYGWIRKEPNNEYPYAQFWHNGSNTMWYAMVVFIPEKNMVIAVTSNDGDFENAQAAALEVVRASVNQSYARAEPPHGTGFSKKSPFAAVRWQDSGPEVKVGDEWFKLVTLNELPVSDILAFSRETYAIKWQMRFEEDLVELLSRMGHPPQDSVKLVVQSLTSAETQVLEDVPMTEANRRMIKAAAREMKK